MRIRRSHAVVWALMFLVIAVSPSAATIMTGNQLAQLMREFEKAQVDFESANSVQASGYLGYIMGVFDATEDLYDAPATITTERLGEIVGAVIDPKPGESLTEEEINLFLEKGLPRYKRPRKIIFDKSWFAI